MDGTPVELSHDTVVVEGDHWFPTASLNRIFFEDGDRSSVWSRKGTASYLDVVVGVERNDAAAWYHPTPWTAASAIAGRVAFWRGVRVGG